MQHISKAVGGAVGSSIGSTVGGLGGAGLAAFALPPGAHAGWYVLTIVACTIITTVGSTIAAVYRAPANRCG